MVTEMKAGSALTFKGTSLYLKNIYSFGNSGLKGGFLFFDCISLKMQYLIVRFSIFIQNLAMNGGVIGITGVVENIKLFIYNNYFNLNFGASKIFLILSFKYILIL